MNIAFFTRDIPRLYPYLEEVLETLSDKKQHPVGTLSQIFNQEGLSGIKYQTEAFEGEILVGLILGGTGHIIKRRLVYDGRTIENFDYFDKDGSYTFNSPTSILKPLIVNFYGMELKSSFLNHYYNYLSLEYKNAKEGKSQTALVYSIEKFLRQLFSSKKITLSIQKGANDPAVKNIYQKILDTESDPVLSWKERQLVFKNYHKDLKEIISTKTRAHGLSYPLMKIRIWKKNIASLFLRILSRPLSNFSGFFYRYTFDKIIWFFTTVKNNLGYSIALAVYGPFTYYFITMPMNPHAMQAVGKVRSAYLKTKQDVSTLFESSLQKLSSLEGSKAIADEVSIKKASAQKKLSPSSIITTPADKPLVIKTGDKKTQEVTPSILNMVMTTDLANINQISWSERMSNFKQMQIAYEENIEYASRMGRLEQLETQYNFPMQVEAAWNELERYNNLIFKIREKNPHLSPRIRNFLHNEVNRTHQLQLYLWDRMGRFMLDQIYVMLDEDREQKRSGYYVGHSFVFMEEMTNILSWRYKNLKKPKGYEKIQALAKAYSKARRDTGNVLNNLKFNSKLFNQKNIYDTKEFRAHMKRQWEILFLQNAKAEEASNMGLNMYNWSVRNTVWILQSFFSAKNEDLRQLIQRELSGMKLSPEYMLSKNKTLLLYETLFHNLNLEYVSIREELMNRIGKDIESAQRMVVINNLREFLIEREKLEEKGIASHQQSPGTNI